MALARLLFDVIVGGRDRVGRVELGLGREAVELHVPAARARDYVAERGAEILRRRDQALFPDLPTDPHAEREILGAAGGAAPGIVGVTGPCRQRLDACGSGIRAG